MMIQIVRHDVREGMLAVALARIGAMTDRMQRQEGFVFRHVGEVVGEPGVFTTVTGWRDEACFEAWEAARKDIPASAPAAAEVYRSVETSRLVTIAAEAP